MRTITTSSGKEFDIDFIGVPRSNRSRICIELKDNRALSQIAADFEGLEAIKKTTEGSTHLETYEGYTKLVSIQRIASAGTVRLMLEKDITTE